jgi:hypothetical protein
MRDGLGGLRKFGVIGPSTNTIVQRQGHVTKAFDDRPRGGGSHRGRLPHDARSAVAVTMLRRHQSCTAGYDSLRESMADATPPSHQ